MAKQRDSGKERYAIQHSNPLNPQDYLRFIHLDGFTSDWRGLGLTDDDLRILQLTICLAPQAAPVIAGTGGLRKLRFSPPSWRRGKRGSLRVLYAVWPAHSVCLLAAAYAKSGHPDISPEQKGQLKRILHVVSDLLDRELDR